MTHKQFKIAQPIIEQLDVLRGMLSEWENLDIENENVHYAFEISPTVARDKKISVPIELLKDIRELNIDFLDRKISDLENQLKNI